MNMKQQARMRVVVADDDPIILQLMESKLTQIGCEPIMAEDGMEAWQHMRGKSADLAIVDLEMPNIDGFALIQCMRGHPKTKHMPIIVVTSRKDSDAIQQAFAAGATSFLTKPVNWSTFGSHIEYLMRLSQSAHQERTRAQRAEAAIRIKDTVMRGAISGGLQSAARIKDAADLISATVADSHLAEAIERRIAMIIEDAEKIETCLTTAQNMTRALCSKVNVRDTLVPLINLLANAQTRIGETSRERNVPVSFTRVPEDTYIACDADGLSLAIGQLLDNAIRYSPEGKTVSLEADVHEDGMMTIAVTDDGPGMDPDFYAACLNPSLVEGDNAERSGNSGVGIPLVKAIAEAHGGALEIRSYPDQGTTAMLVIAADRVHVENEDAA